MKGQLIFLLGLATIILAEEQVQDDAVEESTGLTSIGLPGDLTISDGFLRAISLAGAIVTGVAGLAALLSFLLPLFGFRTCLILGTCDGETTGYNSGVNANSVYDQGYGYQYGSGFRKRSLEYVGPILKALTSAYEKYGTQSQQGRKVSSVKPSEKKRR